MTLSLFILSTTSLGLAPNLDAISPRTLQVEVRNEPRAIRALKGLVDGLGELRVLKGGNTFSLRLGTGFSEDRIFDFIGSQSYVVDVKTSTRRFSDRLSPLNSVKGVKSALKDLGESAFLKKKTEEEREKEREREKEKGKEVEEENGGDFLRSYLYRLQARAYPYDRVDWSAWERSSASLAKMVPFSFTSKTAGANAKGTNGRWAYIGPNNLNTPYRIYYGLRPSAGRVNAVAYDPVTTSTLYVGAASGGVHKSVDGGTTWTALGDKWESPYVSSIAVDPSKPATVYAGTGDFPAFAGFSAGVMKTTDGGLTWTSNGKATFAGLAISGIVVDPENTNILVATAGRGQKQNGGVYRSTDAGVTWTQVVNVAAPWSDCSIGTKDASGKRTYWAVGGGTGGNVYKSTDQGATWTRVTTTLGSGGHQVLSIAASGITAGGAYLLSPLDQKIFKTTDGGTTWTDTTGNFPGGYNWSQSTYDYHIHCGAKASADAVYVGLIDIVMSPDSGGTWTTIGSTYTNNATTHNDQHSFAINPKDPNEVMVGNDGGLYKLVINGTAAITTGLSTNLGITQFYNMVWHPTDPTKMLGGTQDNASPVALGDLTKWENVAGGDGGFNAINFNNPLVQYATIYGFTVIQTKDGWKTSRTISPNAGGDRSPFVTPIYIDASNPNRLYGATNYLWRYDDTTGAWTSRLSSQQLSSTGLIRSVGTSMTNGNVIYTGSEDGELWFSNDGGSSFKRLTGVPNRLITSILVSKTNPFDILVTIGGTGSGHLYRCANTAAGSPVFTNLTGVGATGLPDVPANCVDLDPNVAGTLYVGTDLGVYASTDNGLTWKNATSSLGLPVTEVSSIQANGTTGYLNAATYGRGVWRIKLGEDTGPGTGNVTTKSFAVESGSLRGGTIADLLSADKKVVSVTSALRSEGQVAAISVLFDTSTFNGTVTAFDLSTVISSTSSQVTGQLYVRNQKTGAFEFFKAVNLSGATTLNLTIADVKNYVNTTAKAIEIQVRGIRPVRLGSSSIIVNFDRVSINAS